VFGSGAVMGKVGVGGGGGTMLVAARIALTGVFFIPPLCQLNAHFFNVFQ